MAMEPEDRREPIFELAEKFQFLKENAISRALCGHANSENSFCEKLSIPRNTIRASLEKGSLAAEHQRILADKCKFSLDWPEWNDPNADRATKREHRRDTCEAFKAKYLKHHSREETKSRRLIPLTQVRLYVVGSAVPHPCGDCPVL